jgi:4-hydroxythreonine-4-phosphate dehydrogenase
VRPRVAITLGDPRGIGPEIVAKVMAEPPEGAEYVVIGEQGAGSGTLREANGLRRGPAGNVARTASEGTAPRSPLPITAGLAVKSQIESAVRMALAGEVDAIVTGPAEKAALHAAGIPYPGHTEWLAALAGGCEVAMMLTDERLRVVLVTTHVPLSAVPALVTRERVETVGRITRDALRNLWGIAEPRLAVCALNPHAGEGGLFGPEDAERLAPAARALGAAGPLPADTVFVRALRGEFDAVLAPYHDVGMTAIKVAAFGRGVNVTLGLPFIRTAPDHGTAFDIAGKGIADPGSMWRAVELAGRLAVKAGRADKADEADGRSGR